MNTTLNTALLVLEMQNDYFPNGKVSLEKSLEASLKAQAVLQVYRDHQFPVIHVQHISTHPNASNLLPCTKGAELHDNVKPLKTEIIVKKHYPNSFKDTSLLNYLIKNRINHLMICGMMTHLTIDATVRAAYDLGFSCTVLSDACATRQLEYNHTAISAQNVHYAFLAALQTIYCNVMSTEEVIQKIAARIPA